MSMTTGLGDSDDEDDLDPLTTRGAALLFQGDANARLASLTLGNGAGHPDVMIEEVGEEMDPYDDDDLDADTVEVPASVMSMFRAGGPSPETVGGAQDDDDEVNLADSDDDEIINSPDAKTERVEHDSPTLMKEYGASNFWGSSIDDSLVPDDI
jgi:serine/threonine-protein phosphatase 6 regulatory subunit 3